MKLKPNSALQLFIISEVINSGAEGTTGYNITKRFGDFWNHQQVYRECNVLSQAGILFPTIVNNEGKPDSKVYLMAEGAYEILTDFFRYDVVAHICSDGQMDEFWSQAWVTFAMSDHNISADITRGVSYALVEHLKRQLKEWKTRYVKADVPGSLYLQRIGALEYKLERASEFLACQ